MDEWAEYVDGFNTLPLNAPVFSVNSYRTVYKNGLNNVITLRETLCTPNLCVETRFTARFFNT